MLKIILPLLLTFLWAFPSFAQTQPAVFDVAWTDNSDNEEGFIVQRRQGQQGEFQEIARVAANVTTYRDLITNDAGNLEYCYRMAAFNSAGVSEFSGVSCGISPVIKMPPTAPSGVKVTVTVTVTTDNQ